MALKTIFSDIVILAVLSSALISLTSFAEAKADIVTEQQAGTKHAQPLTPLTPQDRLLALLSNYQDICSSEECREQLIQIRKYARWGDAKSQLVLATAYLYGDGVEQDTDVAISWLKRTAYNSSSNAGKYSLKAYHMMAQLYQVGIGVEPDQQLASKYLDKLAKKNYGPVLFDNAFIEFKQGNLAQGFSLLDKASDSSYPEASYYLARLYQQGDFIEKDIIKAAIYYEKIVRNDYKDSRQRLENIVAEMENNSTTLTANTLTERQSFINKLNATLDIEVFTVNSYTMETKDAMSHLLVLLNKSSRNFSASTGSRIKGSQCGQTSYPCKGMTEEDIEDFLNEGSGN
ncbi:tetratricopeptide repeat protein [Colwellia piezophila]|uniref:tetratricopeptide repeat protein n=1 Tax=Colwellia piezophila TaxID=211668 RepID=UPI00038030AA|nr:tetratricopeptide repeat protein [Colwellia piezophila]